MNSALCNGAVETSFHQTRVNYRISLSIAVSLNYTYQSITAYKYTQNTDNKPYDVALSLNLYIILRIA